MKNKVLIVVDMQNDFISGALGTEMAKTIVPLVKEKINSARKDHYIIFTQDTHDAKYMNTEEGKNLPVLHCEEGTVGWKITDELLDTVQFADKLFQKETFGSKDLLNYLTELSSIEEVELVGLCTDICVLSNAILAKTALPNAHILVDAQCCAGVTEKSHDIALSAMQTCQIEVIGQGKEPWRTKYSINKETSGKS